MQKERIFSADRYFRSCHAATLAATDDGYLAAWFAGTHESHPDTGIWLSRRRAGEWLAPRQVAKVGDVAHFNPVLFRPDNDRIILFFKVGVRIPDWQTLVMHSDDNGETWSEPVELVPGDVSGGRGPVKNKPLCLADGSWLAPASVETRTSWRAFTDRSEDQGVSWQRSNLIGFVEGEGEGAGVIQPTLWESSPGRVHMLLRSTAGKIFRSDSADGGRTWSPAVATVLPNNNSGLDLARAGDGRLFLICNPTADRRKRTPLSILVSSDEGENWPRCCDIETEDVSTGSLKDLDGGEFSYPSIIIHGNKLAAVYTVHRRQIGFWQAEISSLMESTL